MGSVSVSPARRPERQGRGLRLGHGPGLVCLAEASEAGPELPPTPGVRSYWRRGVRAPQEGPQGKGSSAFWCVAPSRGRGSCSAPPPVAGQFPAGWDNGFGLSVSGHTNLFPKLCGSPKGCFWPMGHKNTGSTLTHFTPRLPCWLLPSFYLTVSGERGQCSRLKAQAVRVFKSSWGAAAGYHRPGGER